MKFFISFLVVQTFLRQSAYPLCRQKWLLRSILTIYACCPAPKTGNHSCAIIVMSENIIGFANGNFLHCHDMAENVVKHGGRYCVACGPNKVSCKNTSYTPGISMHHFPKDARLRRLWTQLASSEPSEYSALYSAHYTTLKF